LISILILTDPANSDIHILQKNSKMPKNKKLFHIKAELLSKKYLKFTVFKNIKFTIKTGDSIAITGPNGSGKSTLLKLIAGIEKPTSGVIEYFYNDQAVNQEQLIRYLGFISPTISPYNELTGLENIQFVIGSRDINNINTEELLKRFELYKHKNKRLKYYSSGMKQRLKLLISILHDPPILMLDEPGSNLDQNGKDIIYSYLNSERNKKIIIIATNEEEEAKLCNGSISFN